MSISNDLLAALSSSYSYNQQERDAALQFLQECQPLPGFLLSLIEIVCQNKGDNKIPLEIRTQAILFFKNSLDKYWRKGSSAAVNVQDKAVIRAKLLTLVDEEDRTIARTTALCVGKIARMDFDVDWPDLSTTLLGTMQQAIQHLDSQPQAILILHRCLLFFQQSAKALSANRMIRGKVIMGKLAEQSFDLLVQVYRHFFQSSINTLLDASPMLEPSPLQPHQIELSLLAFKVLNKLSVYGWGGTNTEVATREHFKGIQEAFFKSTLKDFETYYVARRDRLSASGSQLSQALVTLLDRHLMAYGKFSRALLLQNHIIFHGFGITEDLTFICWNLVTEAASSVNGLNYDETETVQLYPEKFVVQCLLFVKSCFTQFPTCKQDFSSPHSAPHLTPAVFAEQCTRVIGSRLLLLTPVDLEKWKEDPEEWVKEEEEEKWQFDIRPCAEAFLKELAVQHNEVVIPVLRQLKAQADAPQNFDQLLLKEAAYTAIGRCPTEMNKVLTFGPWLQSELLPQALGTEQSHLILRRRIAWLIGHWIGEDANTTTQNTIYQILCHLLQKNASTDLAVRLTAAKAIGACDNWEFDVDTFLPYLEVIMLSLAHLLEEVELPETQMRINEVFTRLIDRSGKHIKPHMPLLMQILPKLWSTTDSMKEGNSFKVSIMVTFKSLVEALGTDSHVLHDAVCHFVQISCDPASPAHAYLQEDGLELWRSTIKYAETPSPQLMSLGPSAIALLSDGDILGQILKLIESYCLLAPEEFLQQHIVNILGQFSEILTRSDEKAARPVLSTVDIILQSGDEHVWASAVDGSQLFTAMMRTIQSDASTTVITRYLCTLARIAFRNADVFLRLLQSSASTLGISYQELLQKVISQFLDRYDNLTYPGQRKLVALGLTSLVQTTDPVILDRIDEFITIWLSALGETEESVTGDSDVYYDGNEYDDAVAQPGWGDEVEGSPDVKRYTALVRRDPMHNVKLTAIISQALENTQNLNGGSTIFYQSHLAGIDQSVLKELFDWLSGLARGGD